MPAVHSGVESISCDHARTVLLANIASEDNKGLEREPDIIAALDGQRSELVRSLVPFIFTPGGEPEPFRDCGAGLVPCLRRGALPRCGSRHRSAIAAVSPDGGRNWMAAEEFGPL